MRLLKWICLLSFLLTATLFAEERPKIMVINSNASVEKNVSSNNGEMPELEDENKEPDTGLGPKDVASN